MTTSDQVVVVVSNFKFVLFELQLVLLYHRISLHYIYSCVLFGSQSPMSFTDAKDSWRELDAIHYQDCINTSWVGKFLVTFVIVSNIVIIITILSRELYSPLGTTQYELFLLLLRCWNEKHSILLATASLLGRLGGWGNSHPKVMFVWVIPIQSWEWVMFVMFFFRRENWPLWVKLARNRVWII